MAISDLNTSYYWYNGSNKTTAATIQTIGSAMENTNTIINSQGTGSYAATACANYEINGYTDWYLPTIRELEILYTNKASLSAFQPYSYWSSSENNSEAAYGVNFSDGKTYSYYKNGKGKIRAIRYF